MYYLNSNNLLSLYSDILGFGYADLENRVPCTRDTVMRIASISKPITMAAIAKMWENGKIDLDKPVQYYLPSFPEKEVDGEKVCRLLYHK